MTSVAHKNDENEWRIISSFEQRIKLMDTNALKHSSHFRFVSFHEY